MLHCSLVNNTLFDPIEELRFGNLPLKQRVVQFDNEKCYLLNYVLLMCTPTTTLNLSLEECRYSKYVLYSRWWIEGIQLPETNNKYFVSIGLCFINVYTYSKPKPTPYSNADTLNNVVQHEKKDEILMCACAVN